MFVVLNETHCGFIVKDDRFLLPFNDKHGIIGKNQLQIA